MDTTHENLVLKIRVQDEIRCVVLEVRENRPDDTARTRILSVEVWDEVDKDNDEPLWEDVYITTFQQKAFFKYDLIRQGVSTETAAEAVRTVSVLFDHLGKIQEALRSPA